MGRETIDWFNRTLRPHESKRELVRCEIEGEVPPAEHKWAKSSVMTQVMTGTARHGANYDKMECERCHVTGKRYGLHSHVNLDSKFTLKAFRRCDTSMIHQGLAPTWPQPIK